MRIANEARAFSLTGAVTLIQRFGSGLNLNNRCATRQRRGSRRFD